MLLGCCFSAAPPFINFGLSLARAQHSAKARRRRRSGHQASPNRGGCGRGGSGATDLEAGHVRAGDVASRALLHLCVDDAARAALGDHAHLLEDALRGPSLYP